MKLPELKKEAKQCIQEYCKYVLANTEENISDDVITFEIKTKKKINKCDNSNQIMIILEKELPDFIYDDFKLKYDKDQYKDIAWDYIVDKAHVDGKYDDRLLDYYKQIDDSNRKYFENLKRIIDISPTYISERKHHDKHRIRTRDNLYAILSRNI